VVKDEFQQTFLEYQEVTKIKAEINNVILSLVHDTCSSTEEAASDLITVIAKITGLEAMMIERMEKAPQFDD